ncbi:hypothetical protein [Streptomyces abikoensis]|uniref:Uncharacterized protein n=1 Tax=Streptomyces abikoensis TaxID=97398 RepID=A0ABW7T9D9_9ACTN
MTDDTASGPAGEPAPDNPSLQAPYGYGLSEYSGPIVHILAEEWRSYFWPGSPTSLWAEDREPRHGMSAWALCGHGAQWKTAPPADARLLCRTYRMPAAQRALLLTRVRPLSEGPLA